MVWSLCTSTFIPFFSIFVWTGNSCALAGATTRLIAFSKSAVANPTRNFLIGIPLAENFNFRLQRPHTIQPSEIRKHLFFLLPGYLHQKIAAAGETGTLFAGIGNKDAQRLHRVTDHSESLMCERSRTIPKNTQPRMPSQYNTALCLSANQKLDTVRLDRFVTLVLFDRPAGKYSPFCRAFC